MQIIIYIFIHTHIHINTRIHIYIYVYIYIYIQIQEISSHNHPIVGLPLPDPHLKSPEEARKHWPVADLLVLPDPGLPQSGIWPGHWRHVNHMYTCIYIYIHTYVYIYMYVYIYIHVYVYIYIYRDRWIDWCKEKNFQGSCSNEKPGFLQIFPFLPHFYVQKVPDFR